jgi:antitoxin ParD1/3/4
MNVSLTPALDQYVREKVESGLYNNASEVVREALRLLQDHEEIRQLKLSRLRDELAKGIDDLAAGRSLSFATDDELAAYFARL